MRWKVEQQVYGRRKLYKIYFMDVFMSGKRGLICQGAI
jgi:hypothetical protein